MASLAALVLALASASGAAQSLPEAQSGASVRVLARVEIIRAEQADPAYRPDQTRRTLRVNAQGQQQVEFE